MSDASSQQRTPLFNGEPFERIVAILISLVVIQAAVVGYLESQASIRADEAKRAASHFAIQAMGARARGEIDYGYAFGDAYRRFDAYDTREIIAFDRDNAAAANRFRELRNTVVGLTPLLDDPYLDAETFELDAAQYEVDTYFEEVTLLKEQFLNTAEVDDAWGAKAQTYVAQLTVLAVSLFLFGISTTSGRRTRWLFVSVSSVLSLTMLGWTLLVATTPVQGLSQAAMEAYARAQSLDYVDDVEGAVAFYDVAIAESPAYARAYVGRASNFFVLDELDASIADYETALALGATDSAVMTDLTFAYYLVGELDRAAELSLQRAAMPNADTLDFFDLGLMYFANGEIDNAQQAYTSGLEVAANRVAETRAAGEEVSSTLWFFFDLASSDLEQLVLCMNTGDCFSALPRDLIQATDDDIPAMAEIIAQMKSYSVALEYTGLPPAPLPDATAGALSFADADGNLMDAFPEDTFEVRIGFDYSGFEDGQLFVGKIYVDGNEDLSLRIVDEWLQGSDGTAEYAISVGDGGAFVLLDGEYNAELFLDGQLIANGAFSVASDFDFETSPVAAASTDGDAVSYDLPQIGLTLSTPTDWLSLEQSDVDLYFTSDPTGTQYVYVYLLEDAPDDPQAIARDILALYDMDGTDAGSAITVGGRDAFAFGLTYNDGDVWVGRAFALYDVASGTGVVISAEVIDGEADPNALYESLLAWVEFAE